jgi:hypothetical protein
MERADTQPGCRGHLDVSVALAVGAPVSVAALLNGSEIVKVTTPSDDQGSMSFMSMATMRSSKPTPRSHQLALEQLIVAGCALVYGVDHGTASFPLTSAATTTGAITSTPTEMATAPFATGFDRPFLVRRNASSPRYSPSV